MQIPLQGNGQEWIHTRNEFHYLHHDQMGNKYSNHAEMGMQLLEAAKIAGINITLIPMCYQMGGFNQPQKY